MYRVEDDHAAVAGRDDNEVAERARAAGRSSLQPSSEAPSRIFGLIEKPGTMKQTDKHAGRVTAGGMFQFRGGEGERGGAHKSEMSWPPVQAGEYGAELMEGWRTRTPGTEV